MKTFAVAVVALAGIAQVAAPVRAVDVYLCAIADKGPAASPRYLNLKGDEILSMVAGNRLQFYLAPSGSAVHAYLLHVLPDGTLDREFPGNDGKTEIAPGMPTYFPRRDRWFVLDDNRGRENIILIASAEALPRLDQLLRDNDRAPAPDRRHTARAIEAEIAALRQRYPQPSPGSVRPKLIAGAFRNVAPDPASYAREVSAPGLFVQTYVIDHK